MATMSEETTKKDFSKLYTPGAIIFAGLLVGGGLFFGLSHGSSAPAAAGNAANGQQQPAQAVNIKDVKTDGDPYIGQANAPIALAAWEDFQCPFCRAVEVGNPQIPTAPAMPDLIKQYVDTGKLKIVFKDFEFLGPDSLVDAEWARAVWDLYPSQYLAWRTAMFNQQPQENSLSAADNLAHVKKVTASISGIDVAKVAAQVAAKQSLYDAAIQADQQEGASFGITGTPAFITGTTEIDGAQPLSAFQSAIGAQLK